MAKISSVFAIFSAIIFLCKPCEGAKGYGPGDQDWGYLDVRDGAHMFYWLYYTTYNVSSYTQRPLVIWLVGGPGSSASGYGNFEELGPLTLDGEERSFSWDKYANLLFVDSPVGAGYSYVDNESLLTRNNKEIALDFVAFMKAFYATHPEFESVPLHLFGESYGGKMVAEIAYELYKAIERQELRSNFKSVVMMTPRINPLEGVLAHAPYLLSLGIVDTDGFDTIMAEAYKYADFISQRNWTAAATQINYVSYHEYITAKGLNFFNVLKKFPIYYDGGELKAGNADRVAILEKVMNGVVAKTLNVNSTWGREELVKSYLLNDIDRPIVNIITELLDSTDLKVGIVSAQLDLVAGPLGLIEFMKNMHWSYKSEYDAAPRQGFEIDGVLEGYTKNANKFTFFWINRAGHMLAQDNPAALNYVLNYFTGVDTFSHPSFI